jgi:hypothetical protein
MAASRGPIPGDRKAYIVFKGKPSVWYVDPDDKGSGPDALHEAEQQAARLCEQDQEPYTVLCVPQESVEIGIMAKYHGVVMHALSEFPTDSDE